jgi:hypothetical protein
MNRRKWKNQKETGDQQDVCKTLHVEPPSHVGKEELRPSTRRTAQMNRHDGARGEIRTPTPEGAGS